MHIILLVLLVVALVFGPQVWARHVLRRYSMERSDMRGTGGELARHLAARLHIPDLRVEITAQGDHYDPLQRVVRLSEQNFNGRSLTAVAVAAHEVGHALQHHLGYAPLNLRTRLVPLSILAQQIGSMFMLAIPLITLITRAPHGGLLMFAAGVLSMSAAILVHLVTLPVEFDASFKRALPVLVAGKYIEDRDQVAVRSILRACAFTYLAASLASLLNLARWIAVFRR